MRNLDEQIVELEREAPRDAHERRKRRVGPACLDSPHVGWLDPKALRRLLNGPPVLLAQLAHAVSELHGDLPEARGLTVMKGLGDRASSYGHGVDSACGDRTTRSLMIREGG